MRVLLVTNDFPPRPGGIQTYLHELATRLPAGCLTVLSSSWPGAEEFDAAQRFPVIRRDTRILLPTPDVAHSARRIVAEHGCDRVWFGAAAPLGLLAGGLRAAGVERVVASTHGHEVGWSMTSPTRAALGTIGRHADAVTTVSAYTGRRLGSAFGAAPLEPVPPGVDTEMFRPDAGARVEVRRRHGLGTCPVVLCVSRLVSRKGQDALIRALPSIRARVPGTRLLLVGGGPRRRHLQRLADRVGVAGEVVFTGSVPRDELPGHYATGDVFAMPCRTRGGGLDVEGLGMVFLEAAAAGLPVVAGNSGGAPETVSEEDTGHVVDGRSVLQVADLVAGLLEDPERAAKMGLAGRDRMIRDWNWDRQAARMSDLLGLT